MGKTGIGSVFFGAKGNAAKARLFIDFMEATSEGEDVDCGISEDYVRLIELIVFGEMRIERRRRPPSRGYLQR